jgi:2,4-dichlorophenol 6-monooxygenase
VSHPPQTFVEPILFKTACSRGTQARMRTEYLRRDQDAEGVTTTCRDRLTGKAVTIRSKDRVGADGGNSLVAEQAGLPFEGMMGVGGSTNILFRADPNRSVAPRPSVLYGVMQPGADAGGIGMGLVRMVRRWNAWLIVWGHAINPPPPEVTPEFATGVARQLAGVPYREIEHPSASTRTVNSCDATPMQKGRGFIMGDAAHRHPPSNGWGLIRPFRTRSTCAACSPPTPRGGIPSSGPSRFPTRSPMTGRWAGCCGRWGGIHGGRRICTTSCLRPALPR